MAVVKVMMVDASGDCVNGGCSGFEVVVVFTVMLMIDSGVG